MQRKKIIYFIEVLGWGGIETFIANVLQKINLNKYQVEIVCINKISDHFDELFNRLGVKVVVLKKERIANPIKRYWVGVKAFGKYLDGNKCEIIHFHISNAIDFLHVQMAKSKKVKYRISHSHNSDVNKKYKRVGHEILKVFLKNAPSHRVACSLKAYNWLYSNAVNSKSPIILKNGIDVNKFVYDSDKAREVKEKLNIKDKFVIIHIGRFNLQKNHEFLIEFFDEYAKTDKDSVLLLIGSGELKDDIISKVSKLETKDQIVFCGEVDDIPGYLMASDVFVLPSLYEGLPVVGIEAQTTGINCIFSDTITQELNINSNIKFCSIEKTDFWVDEITKLKKSNYRYENADRVVEAGYDIQSTVNEIEELYDSMAL